jgi:uncharacterized protein
MDPQNNEYKRKFIKDPLWGSILLLSWERDLIRHPLVNRLHNVQQNSSAYKVYPALRVSRFAHSLGVMHAATQIFTNALVESREGVFRTESGDSLEEEADTLREYFHNQDDLARLLKEVQIACPMISRELHPVGERFGHILAVIRVCAILHDIGHLPWSHVGEFAIERLASYPESGSPESASWKPLLDAALGKRGKKGPKLHEAFGRKLMHVLAQNYLRAGNSSAILVALVRAAEAVLHTSRFPIARSVLSSPIDADRIDFVRRDTYFSGLLNSSVDYTRLFAFFEIRQNADEKGHVLDEAAKPYFIAPGKRAVSEVEKLLWERFQDYKYIVCHHRVHLYDELIERCIVNLTSLGRMGRFASLITEILNLSERSDDEGSLVAGIVSEAGRLLSLLTELDDYWLEMQLRQEYAARATGDEEARKGPLWDMLVGYIENRKRFVPAFKVDGDFWELAKPHPEFRKLMSLQGGERTARLQEIAHVVNRNKYLWEQELTQNTGRTVIIGDLSIKLSVGISSPDAALSLGLTELYKFLMGKVGETPPFNFWYTSSADEVKGAAFRRRVEMCQYICGKIEPQLHLSIH